jgi:valyl-tRNA synthetase
VELAKTYNPSEIEDKWYATWLQKKYFHAQPNNSKKPYTIVMPPPNVTGVLHMGHTLNNTIQDVLIRRARMLGYETCWVPGTDHASIATEAKVVAMLKEKGIDKKNLSRDEFLKHAWAWKEKYGGIILEQLKKMGCSCDWERTRFTMEDKLSNAVIRTFVDLYNKGLVYRGYRMVNWDPTAKTSLSDEEVIYKEVRSKLYYVKYFLEGSQEFITVATTRPETILGDVAVCVHPQDERYLHLHGKKVIVPLANRTIPIITDEYVDIEFGTGCLKITPAHDLADYEIGVKYNLPIIDTLNDDGTLSEACGIEKYIGKDRFVVRKIIANDLETAELIVKVEEINNSVGCSERTDAVIEPRLSKQWFVRMKKLAQPALENVMNDNIQFHPAKFKNTYRHWMENVKDWCISRQLWWGQRIPAYYLPNGDYVVAETAEKALALAQQKSNNANLQLSDLQQDEDVLDTWFSSWLWPISVFDGFEQYNEATGKIEIEKNEDLRYFYPTDTLVTAPEILFFWVARMIMAGYEYLGEMPFKNVYLTGIVRDKQRRKMSKSLGNSPDPLDLIAQYGADAVRVGMLFSSPAGNDLLFDEKLIEQGRNFTNKIWNAFRLVQGWSVNEAQQAQNSVAIAWFENRFNQVRQELETHFAEYRLSEAIIAIYKLIWDDFCSWYLEMVKPQNAEKTLDAATYQATIQFFDELMRLLHPFMPFITEEIWQLLQPRQANESICLADYPTLKETDTALLADMNTIFEVITQIRNTRSSKGISPKETFELFVKSSHFSLYEKFAAVIQQLANISTIQATAEKVTPSLSFVVKADEFFIPYHSEIDAATQRAELEKELEYMRGFLNSVNKKLSNEKFVQNAPPQVLATEQKKKADAEAKIATLLAALEGV